MLIQAYIDSKYSCAKIQTKKKHFNNHNNFGKLFHNNVFFEYTKENYYIHPLKNRIFIQNTLIFYKKKL